LEEEIARNKAISLSLTVSEEAKSLIEAKDK